MGKLGQSVLLAHGNGGVEGAQLVEEVLYPVFKDSLIGSGEDAGVADLSKLLDGLKHTTKEIALSTDSYTVAPFIFPGGDIGKLAVCGSCNDVTMMGARPTLITLGLMIEEGFKIKDLQTIIQSFAKEIQALNVKLVSGDTKVLPKGSLDNIFLNTTCLGIIQKPNISAYNLQAKSDILISGSIGRHGALIFSLRERMDFKSKLKSDCASLYPMLEPIFLSDYPILALRDATRGGIASVLNEWANTSKKQIQIYEKQVPISNEVRGICEILGFEAYSLACEGVCVLCVPKSCSKEVLKILKQHPLGKDAAIIGEVLEGESEVILKSEFGGSRLLEFPSGELLPRIC